MAESVFKQSELDFCPHSLATYKHRWHGLPVKGCGGSHLNEEEARRNAKPFEANDEKYLSRISSMESLNLRFFWESIFSDYEND